MEEKKKNPHQGHRKRIREAILRDPEMETFSDFEVLEYLLTVVIPFKDTNVLAHELIDDFGSLYGVFSATAEELFCIKGMTEAAAHFLPNLLPILRRAETSRTRRGAKINTIRDAAEAFMPYFKARSNELFFLMMLDINDNIIQIDCLSKGGASFANVDIGNIITKASRMQASKVILAHNHPGGNLLPSSEDIQVTATIAFLLGSMQKELLDHIIFCGEEYCSLYENDLVKRFLESEKTYTAINKEKPSNLWVNTNIPKKLNEEKKRPLYISSLSKDHECFLSDTFKKESYDFEVKQSNE
jgi:DNA repair protein RadC